ncbi:MAG: response regulator [Candidatus Rokubacteria bacterium]|nr:response regulator [Candidatus Rokubacteria bacterium]MBI2017043.1 response regulator [Candidatus Rokubacteria bacterium]MBI2155392.1 response regulator [Candidatus Rokubacteria bacterium]MBI2494737.1 response regulator [Candidatus Rokubacteria bacterium]MBI4255359.1 response regulator [Candidatus Rokubacteria bacterium]
MAKILVVDDEPDICEILKEMLEGDGHAVTVAGDGHAATRLLDTERVDLILTDIFMPGKDGLETIMEIRRDHPAVKIIAMSGGGRTGELGYLADAVRLGAFGSISKPFEEARVLRTVRDALAS